MVEPLNTNPEDLNHNPAVLLKKAREILAAIEAKYPLVVPSGRVVHESYTPVTFPPHLWQALKSTSTVLPPRFHLVTEYTTWFVPAGVSLSPVVYTSTLMPRQTSKVLISECPATRQASAPHLTIAESEAVDVLAGFQQHVDAEVTARGPLAPGDLQYLRPSSWEIIDRAFQECPLPVHAAEPFHCGAGDASNPEPLQVAQERAKDERGATDAILSAALLRHVREKEVGRQQTISDLSDPAAVSGMRGRVEEITNPSEVAPMTLYFFQPEQEFVAIRAITGVCVAFLAGASYKYYSLEEFNVAMGDHLRLDAPGARAAVDEFRQLIRGVAVVADYLGRPVQAITESSGGTFEFAKETYVHLLEGALDERDAIIVPARDHVFGVVISATHFKVPAPGYVRKDIMGAPCVDDAALRLHEISSRAGESSLPKE